MHTTVLLFTSDGSVVGISLDPALLNIIVINTIVGVLLPLLVQVAAKHSAPAWLKTIINLFVSAATGVLVPLLSADTIDWKLVIISIFQVFVLSVASHYGLFKPAKVTGSGGVIAKALPGGIGPKAPAPDDSQKPAA